MKNKIHKMLSKKTLLCLGALTGLLSAAPSQAQFFMPEGVGPVLSIGGGGVWTGNLGRNQDLYIPNNEYYKYRVDDRSDSNGVFDIFLGGEWEFCPRWAAQLGVGYTYMGSFSVEGDYEQGFDPQSSDIYTYDYRVRSQQVQAEGKLLFEMTQMLRPYLYGGLGASFNKASNFNADYPIFLTFSRDFENHTSSSFTWSVGAGLDVQAFDCLRLGVGYRFADLGRVSLGQSYIDETPVTDTLSQRHLYTNMVLGHISFIY